jgi:hypothetical protein
MLGAAAVLAPVLLAAPAHAQPDPLATVSAAGMVACLDPDKARKTCGGMDYYEHRGGASYTHRAVVLMDPKGPVVVEMVLPVEVRNGAACELVRKEDLMMAKVRVGGRLLPPEEAAPDLEFVVGLLESALGKEYCTTYVVEGDSVMSKTSIAGVYRPGLDTHLMWVKGRRRLHRRPLSAHFSDFTAASVFLTWSL